MIAAHPRSPPEDRKTPERSTVSGPIHRPDGQGDPTRYPARCSGDDRTKPAPQRQQMEPRAHHRCAVGGHLMSGQRLSRSGFVAAAHARSHRRHDPASGLRPVGELNPYAPRRRKRTGRSVRNRPMVDPEPDGPPVADHGRSWDDLTTTNGHPLEPVVLARP
jgi:hypothetical protein